MSPSSPTLVALTVLVLAGAVQSADHIVDARGITSAFTTVNAAMAVAQPGDRILVLPGDYPAFQFSRGVHVHGLGNQPSDVRITRVDYHVSIPNTGYDTSLTNLELGSAGSMVDIPLSGNELPPGVLVVDGVTINGGVFLGGGPDGFAVMITNTRVTAGTGAGFLGAAVHIGGQNNRVDIIDSAIRAWDADADAGVPAGIALRLVAGTTATVVRSTISAGHGASDALDLALSHGAVALVDGPGAAVVSVRLDGGTVVLGGDGIHAAGGDAVDVTGSIELGDALIVPGVGSPDGSAFGASLPTDLPVALHLRTEPALIGALSGAGVASGDTLAFELPQQSAPSAIALSLTLGMPDPVSGAAVQAPFVLFVVGPSLALTVPALPGATEVPGVMLFGQGWVRDPTTNALLTTNPTAVRVDLLAFPR